MSFMGASVLCGKKGVCFFQVRVCVVGFFWFGFEECTQTPDEKLFCLLVSCLSFVFFNSLSKNMRCLLWDVLQEVKKVT